MKTFQNFIEFIRERGVVGLAIGFLMGGAVSDFVKSFISDIVNPIIAVLLGSVQGLENATFSFFGAEILWGSFISALINFLIILAVVYFGFKGLGLEKLDKKKDA